jgi:hypothetical protein
MLIVTMNLLESQDILLGLLKIFGFFPINFDGKFKKLKNHLFNLVISIALITTFAVVGVTQVNQVLLHTTEMDSALGYIVTLIEIVSEILCFAIIKLYLLAKSCDVVEKYFDKLRDLEATVRSHYARNKKMNKINKDLRKSTLRQEILVLAFYLFVMISFGYVTATDKIFLYTLDGSLYSIFNCFFIQILLFLKMNMEFARRLQSHLNQVLLNQQKHHLHFNIEDFIKVHRKIEQYLAALNEAFGFIFLVTFAAVYGSMVPQLYMNIVTVLQSYCGISAILAIHIILNFIWAMFSYYHLGRFAFECDKMQDEVNFSIT